MKGFFVLCFFSYLCGLVHSLPKGDATKTAEVECGGFRTEGLECPHDGAVGNASPALDLGDFRPFHPHTLSQLLLREPDFLPSLFDGLSNAIFFRTCFLSKPCVAITIEDRVLSQNESNLYSLLSYSARNSHIPDSPNFLKIRESMTPILTKEML